MHKCIFLDRDGTVCEEMNYLDDYRKMIIYPFALDAIKIMKEKGYNVFIVTNQSGVAKGKFSLNEAERQKEYVIKYFSERGVSIDGYYYCPHHKDGIVLEYSIECDCRKPKIGLLERAIELNSVDREGSFVVGDKIIDMELAKNAGIKGVLVLTGYGRKELEKVVTERYFKVCEDLLSFAKCLR